MQSLICKHVKGIQHTPCSLERNNTHLSQFGNLNHKLSKVCWFFLSLTSFSSRIRFYKTELYLSVPRCDDGLTGVVVISYMSQKIIKPTGGPHQTIQFLLMDSLCLMYDVSTEPLSQV